MKIINIDMNLSSSELGRAKRFLILDRVPTARWQAIFNELHKNSMDTAKRAVTTSGKYLEVECSMDEIQQQVDRLKALCQQTDVQLQAEFDESQRKEQERVNQIEEKRKIAREQYSKLKF